MSGSPPIPRDTSTRYHSRIVRFAAGWCAQVHRSPTVCRRSLRSLVVPALVDRVRVPLRDDVERVTSVVGGRDWQATLVGGIFGPPSYYEGQFWAVMTPGPSTAEAAMVLAGTAGGDAAPFHEAGGTHEGVWISLLECGE
jgi:hypothetical protein